MIYVISASRPEKEIETEYRKEQAVFAEMISKDRRLRARGRMRALLRSISLWLT